jgi:superfamily II RNA helicase
MDSPPEPLMSRIHINFSMTLNLLLSHRPKEVKDLLELSFANYQQKSSGSSIQRQLDEILELLKQILPNANCDTSDPYEILDNIQAGTEQKKEARRLAMDIRDKKLLDSFKPYLEKGRLFLHKDKGIYVLFNSYMHHGRVICAAQDIGKKVRARKGKIRLRKVPLNKIILLYDRKLDLPEEYSMNELQDILDIIDTNDLEVLPVEGTKDRDRAYGMGTVEGLGSKLFCKDCEHLHDCHGKRNRELNRALKSFRSLAYNMEGTGEGLWISFKRHLRFLKETDFVDQKEFLTADGIWASKLRLDQPLLIAEAIRKGGFDSLSPEVMAGCIALFVWDRDQDVELKIEEPETLKDIEDGAGRVIESMEDVIRLKKERGFENPPILFWPAAALFLWARGASWEHLIRCVPIGEGDMASLIVRTADHLRQVANLKETHPGLAGVAKNAIGLILREPVLIP